MKKQRKRRKRSYEVWQKHHLEYGPKPPERVVQITRTEHFFCSRMEAYAKAHKLSKGMCEALEYYCQKYGDKTTNHTAPLPIDEKNS